MATLFIGLQHLRASVHPQVWTELSRHARDHPLRDVLHQDPMTRRSFEHPRGRPGDAVVVDAFCGRCDPKPSTPIGRAVHDVAVGRPIARALRHRNAWLGFQIDRAADRVESSCPSCKPPRGARVLAVGCGHLREANLSSSAPSGTLEELVAIDGDHECLAVVESTGLPQTRAVEMSIQQLLSSDPRALTEDLGHFDLIYAADAYEELEPRRGRALTRRLFDLLRPAGRLLFGTLLPTAPDSAYLEAFMGWPPGDRDLTTLVDLTVRIADEEAASRRVLRDPFGAIGYCLVERAA